MAGGGHAQYARLPEKAALALAPRNLSLEEAVTLPFGADTAITYLRDFGRLAAGHALLVLGAWSDRVPRVIRRARPAQLEPADFVACYTEPSFLTAALLAFRIRSEFARHLLRFVAGHSARACHQIQLHPRDAGVVSS